MEQGKESRGKHVDTSKEWQQQTLVSEKETGKLDTSKAIIKLFITIDANSPTGMSNPKVSLYNYWSESPKVTLWPAFSI